MPTRAQRVEVIRAHAEALRPVIAEIIASGVTTLTGISNELNLRGIKATKGGIWFPLQISILLRRLEIRAPKSAVSRVSNSAAVRNIADNRARALAPLIAEIRGIGYFTLAAIAQQLNERGSTTHRGYSWSASQVRRVLMRLDRI